MPPRPKVLQSNYFITAPEGKGEYKDQLRNKEFKKQCEIAKVKTQQKMYPRFYQDKYINTQTQTRLRNGYPGVAPWPTDWEKVFKNNGLWPVPMGPLNA